LERPTKRTPFFKGSWGYYPCSYLTFCKLKFLKKKFHEALRQHAKWERWIEKEPQNKEDPPDLVPGFSNLIPYSAKEAWHVYWLAQQEQISRRKVRNGWISYITDNAVEEAFHIARMPQFDFEKIEPLPISVEEIDQFLRKFPENPFGV